MARVAKKDSKKPGRKTANPEKTMEAAGPAAPKAAKKRGRPAAAKGAAAPKAAAKGKPGRKPGAKAAAKAASAPQDRVQAPVKIVVGSRTPLSGAADTLVTWLSAGKARNRLLSQIDRRAQRLAKKLEKRGEISAERGRTGQFYLPGAKPKKIYVIGAGEKGKLDQASVKGAVADMVRAARDCGGRSIAFDADTLLDSFAAREAGFALGEAFATCQYRFEKYLHREPTRTISDFAVTTRLRRRVAEIREGARLGAMLGESVNMAKDIGNEPSNVMTPKELAARAEAVAREHGLECEILGPAEMEKLGMGLLLAVSRGSAEEPRLIKLVYRGDRRSKKFTCIVGKGITFDAGGINLKQGTKMFEMKRDLSGGAVALGVMKMVARLGLTENVACIIPACENMPQGNAYKPGDIYLSMAGKYVEIMNTDAEGRLILADAMTYAQKEFPVETLVDIGTLTTTTLAVIGPAMYPVFSNDDGLYKEMEEASRFSGEQMFRFPIAKQYKKGVRSYFADLKNLTMSQPSFLKTALFLDEFVEKDVRWFHFDIASVDSANKESGVNSRGATMTSLRTLADWFLKRHKIL